MRGLRCGAVYSLYIVFLRFDNKDFLLVLDFTDFHSDRMSKSAARVHL